MVLMVLVVSVTRPSLVSSRVLPSPPPSVTTKMEKKANSVMKEKVQTVVDGSIRNRALIEGQYHTMSSGPSRRGSARIDYRGYAEHMKTRTK
ncbi:hypothetical protein PIB30_036107 [Stylosanthes scabra]|uniref:Uncharacterized protein n=1 Tax=Stylosanthes scabra TaxID=79078 RepID=A0ABU6UF72_9FABA|nr:hypothetical protein [Stylosanthes scabra]